MRDPPDPSADGQRDERGRFTTGNRLGRGNPHAAKVARLRSALLESVSEEDVRAVVEALLREAKAGNVQAVKELLERTLGRPEALDVLERVEALEELLAENAGPPGGR